MYCIFYMLYVFRQLLKKSCNGIVALEETQETKAYFMQRYPESG